VSSDKIEHQQSRARSLGSVDAWAMTMTRAHTPSTSGPRRYRYLRHSLPVRVMHWVNVIALLVLLMSGLQIFNAHPALYWGKSSYTGRPPVLQMHAEQTADGREVGVTEIFGRSIRTTGVFGLSKDSDGALAERGFPSLNGTGVPSVARFSITCVFGIRPARRQNTITSYRRSPT
jgi:hypothetical protein